MNNYKTLEELEEELGDKFEEFMYKSNIELLTKVDKAIEYIEEKAPQSLCLPNGVYDMRRIDKTELLNILKGSDKE